MVPWWTTEASGMNLLVVLLLQVATVALYQVLGTPNSEYSKVHESVHACLTAASLLNGHLRCYLLCHSYKLEE